jgi:hypothetical protein
MAGTYLHKGPNSTCPNLIFEDKAFVFTENILKQKKLKQSSPWVSPPLLAGVLQALPPRNKSKVLAGSLPAKIR